MLHFNYSTLINAPVEVVWQFHDRSDILEKLTPPWQPVTIVSKQGGLAVGATIEFRIQLGLIPVRWVAKHVESEKPYLFTDVQLVGPLVSWRHEHQFTNIEGKTCLTDSINYELPGGSLAEFCLGWWVNSRLAEMFKYRHQVTKEDCESNLSPRGDLHRAAWKDNSPPN
ncbi:SRPBCC family protein [Gloeocapsa sp. PCC 73106]|uniref:SRPBCC family protein n=1 Tax=Gloeocapsa sp. PCC 73106 TaxID=102232 RepID=UPI0002ACE588|nr:SRPBCC family protein [Gloeocapsa sp. PCC 73106]ELR96794.1 hypothetical protein GLO73106DRAFT_00005930 [Gloeocapsa sp. PCC 73106]